MWEIWVTWLLLEKSFYFQIETRSCGYLLRFFSNIITVSYKQAFDTNLERDEDLVLMSLVDPGTTCSYLRVHGSHDGSQGMHPPSQNGRCQVDLPWWLLADEKIRWWRGWDKKKLKKFQKLKKRIRRRLTSTILWIELTAFNLTASISSFKQSTKKSTTA